MEGWILDVYPDYKENRIKIWLKTRKGEDIFLSEEYHPCFYVSGAYPEALKKRGAMGVSRERKSLLGGEEIEVWKTEFSDYRKFQRAASKMMRDAGFTGLQLFDVDIPIAQRYLFEKSLFPLGLLDLDSFQVLDDPYTLRYEIPRLTSAYLNVKSSDGLYRRESPIRSILIKSDGEVRFEGGTEADMIRGLMGEIARLDPDILYTSRGDSHIFPYLLGRVEANDIQDFYLGRCAGIHGSEVEASYLSYGRVYFRPKQHMLNGRIHIDVFNSFLYQEGGLHGIIELSRLSGIPLQAISRVTPGHVITNMQLKYACKNGIPVPWKRQNPEAFKNLLDLIKADRGGFIFEPRVGIHEDVVEIDFASMFPNIMVKYNISPETVLCSCCPGSKNRVPVLDYNICENRTGIIPKVLGPIIEKRQKYKEMLRRGEDGDIKGRRDALKWILVTSFGYMGYRNARFGRIEGHEAITSFGRELLLRAASMAEERGFQVLHGIVDSLWVKKHAAHEEFASLVKGISRELGIPMDIEGKYKWIVFLPSKIKKIGVMNRYYGLFEDGKLKVRGIEIRRRDSPEIVRIAQKAMLEELGSANNIKEFQDRIPRSLEVLRSHIEAIKKGGVRLDDLIFSIRISKRLEEYRAQTLTYAALVQMRKMGVRIKPGEFVRYLVRDAKARRLGDRVVPAEFLGEKERYDVSTYVEHLLRAGESILLPFGYTIDTLRKIMEKEKRQLTLLDYQ